MIYNISTVQSSMSYIGQVIAKELSNRHLRDYMCKTMDQTTMLLDFIMPILKGTRLDLRDTS